MKSSLGFQIMEQFSKLELKKTQKAANLFDNWCFLALGIQLISGSIEGCILGNG